VNYDEMDGDRRRQPATGTAKPVVRLMSFAQIT